MSKCIRLTGLLAGLGCLMAYINIPAFPTGAPPGHTGAEGEADCSICHFGELASSAPTLELSGLPATVEAGSHQLLELVFSHPEMQVAGIQASIRALGKHSESIGRLLAQGLKSIQLDEIVYINHPNPIIAESGEVKISIDWDVPEDFSGIATLNVSMVAGNNDESSLGDSVLTLEQQVIIISD